MFSDIDELVARDDDGPRLILRVPHMALNKKLPPLSSRTGDDSTAPVGISSRLGRQRTLSPALQNLCHYMLMRKEADENARKLRLAETMLEQEREKREILERAFEQHQLSLRDEPNAPDAPPASSPALSSPVDTTSATLPCGHNGDHHP